MCQALKAKSSAKNISGGPVNFLNSLKPPPQMPYSKSYFTRKVFKRKGFSRGTRVLW
jgi:hypothetical protein